MSDVLQCCGGGLVIVWVIVALGTLALVFGGKG